LVLAGKNKLRQDAISFVTKFVNFKTFKEVLSSVKNELPKLLGYRYSCMFVLDATSQNLQAIGFDEVADRMERE
jgi:hypothetical protein